MKLFEMIIEDGTENRRLKKLIQRLNEIDSVGEFYNPVLSNVVGGECWQEVALIQDSEVILHQDLDRLESLINDYDSRMAKFID